MRINYGDEYNQAFPMWLLEIAPGKKLCASIDGTPFICERVHGSDVCRPMYSEPNKRWHEAIVAWLEHETHKSFVSATDIRWQAMTRAERLTAETAPLPDHGPRVIVTESWQPQDGFAYFACRINEQGVAGWVYRTTEYDWALREATRIAEIWNVPLINKLPGRSKPKVNFIPMDDA